MFQACNRTIFIFTVFFLSLSLTCSVTFSVFLHKYYFATTTHIYYLCTTLCVRLGLLKQITSPFVGVCSGHNPETTDVVLTEKFSSLSEVVHSASYPPGKANQVAAYTSGSAAELTQRSRKSFVYIQVVAFRPVI